MGGTYLFLNEAGHRVAIVKPCDEEPFAPNNPKAGLSTPGAIALSKNLTHTCLTHLATKPACCSDGARVRAPCLIYPCLCLQSPGFL